MADLIISDGKLITRARKVLLAGSGGTDCINCFHQAYRCDDNQALSYWTAAGTVTPGAVYKRTTDDVCLYWGGKRVACPDEGDIADFADLDSIDDCFSCTGEPPGNPITCLPIPYPCDAPPRMAVLRIGGKICGPGCNVTTFPEHHWGGGATWSQTIVIPVPGVIPATNFAVNGGYWGSETCIPADVDTRCFLDADVSGSIVVSQTLGGTTPCDLWGGSVTVVAIAFAYGFSDPRCTVRASSSALYLSATIACVGGILVPTITTPATCYANGFPAEFNMGQNTYCYLTDA